MADIDEMESPTKRWSLPLRINELAVICRNKGCKMSSFHILSSITHWCLECGQRLDLRCPFCKNLFDPIVGFHTHINGTLPCFDYRYVKKIDTEKGQINGNKRSRGEENDTEIQSKDMDGDNSKGKGRSFGKEEERSIEIEVNRRVEERLKEMERKYRRVNDRWKKRVEALEEINRQMEMMVNEGIVSCEKKRDEGFEKDMRSNYGHPRPLLESEMEKVAKTGEAKQLEWLFNEGFELDEIPLFRRVASYGTVEMMKWMRENDFRWDSSVFCWAITGEKRENINWLMKNGCPWDPAVFAEAAMFEDLETMQWLEQNNCYIGHSAFNHAFSDNAIQSVGWLMRKGYKWHYPHHYQQLYMLKWFMGHGYVLSEKTFRAAVANGNLEILEFLKERNCKWNPSDVWARPLDRGEKWTRGLNWLEKNGYPDPFA